MASAYADAGRVLLAVDKGSSVRNASYKTKDPARNMALVSAVLARRDRLEAALQHVGIRFDQPSQRRVALLALYDVVAGRGLPKRAGGRLVRALKENREALLAAYGEDETRVRERRRFARRNTLFDFELPADLGLVPDPHVPDLFEFPSSLAKKVATHESVGRGRLVLQDKASCFPALTLVGDASPSIILDACAAPGNKTSHLAALAPNARVLALDRDPDRFSLLEARLRLAGASNVEARLDDFLTIDPRDYPVTAILLDPSCSGSGTLDHPARKDRDRLERLAGFQLKALVRALTAFPEVTRVTYSTCSVYDEENENVVADALSQAPDFQLHVALPSWPRRGRAHPRLTLQQSNNLVRVDPDLDNCTGFFLALFVRSSSSHGGHQRKRSSNTGAERLRCKLRRLQQRRRSSGV